MKIIWVLLTILFLLLSPFQSVSASTGSGTGQGAVAGAGGTIANYVDSLTSNCTTEEVAGIFCIVVKTINLLLGIAGGVAILVLVYGGIMYMVSGGDEKQLGNAKAAVTYSIMGLLIILGAVFIVNTVLSGLTG